MGYFLNSLGNLTIDENVKFYVFVVNGQYREPLYDMVQNNFRQIAQSIGGNAVVALGTDPEVFTSQVAQAYLGDTDQAYFDMLPAMVITNAHPQKLTKDSLRLVVPLRDAEARFGGWAQFFSLMSSYVRGESDEFLRRFERKEDLVTTANKVLGMKPGIFGISINGNELVERWNKRRLKLATKRT